MLFKKNKLSIHEQEEVKRILNKFVNSSNAYRFLVNIEFKNRNIILWSNKPGLLIGKEGMDYNKLTEQIKEVTNNKVKEVIIKEMRHIISNFGIL